MKFDAQLQAVRAVYDSEIIRHADVSDLERFMADRVPYFYKDPHDIAEAFKQGYFLTAIHQVLLRLPTADDFRKSHFGEILAAVYAEEVLGLRLLYSKLSLLTSENANAYKMDLLFYRPGRLPAEFVFAEVKSSMKCDLPAEHHKSCFPDLFRSLNAYRSADLEFDLAVIVERLVRINEPDRSAIQDALLPHRRRLLSFAGFCVIDSSTRDVDEAVVLATRRSDREFDVDLLCVAELPDVVDETFRLLQGQKQ
jgi:hypothetical protein